MTTQMIIRIDDKVKSQFARLAQFEGKNTSEMIRELMEDYIQSRDMGTYVDDLWKRMGTKLRSRGVGTREISRAVRQSRALSK